MAEASFASNATSSIFRVLADNATVATLIPALGSCSTLSISNSSTSPSPYNDTDPTMPKPEEAVQYYRASSAVLTLDGYNNTASLSNNPSFPNTPLPSGVDTTLLSCLNKTIGQAIPLVDGAGLQYANPSIGLVGLGWVFWCLFSFVV
jgi:hypothetical protein